MRRVRSGDGHEVEPLSRRQAALAPEHFAPVAVGSLRGDAVKHGELAAPLRHDVQRSRREFEEAVKACADPMSAADLAVLPATNHAPEEFALH